MPTLNRVDDLMAYIAEHFPFTPEQYPELGLLEEFTGMESRKLHFKISHSLFHLNKPLGRLAGELEEFDHSKRKQMDDEVLRAATAKLVVSSLNLANALGMSPEELLVQIPKVMKT